MSDPQTVTQDQYDELYKKYLAALGRVGELLEERDSLRAQIMRLRPKVREPYRSHPGYHGHGESIIDGPYFHTPGDAGDEDGGGK